MKSEQAIIDMCRRELEEAASHLSTLNVLVGADNPKDRHDAARDAMYAAASVARRLHPLVMRHLNTMLKKERR